MQIDCPNFILSEAGYQTTSLLKASKEHEVPSGA